MQPSTRGLVVLAAAVVLWSCSGDPTGSFQEGDQRIQANPSSLFLDQGESTFVSVQLVDSAGNQYEADFEAAAGGGVTVSEDTNFLPAPGGNLMTTARFNVLGNTPGVSSFTVTANGETLDVPVRVLPIQVTATFSNPTPAANEPVTVSAPGFIFSGVESVDFAGIPAVVLGVAEDGSSVTFLPPPGTTGPATISGIVAEFSPEVPLSLDTDVGLTVAPVVPLAGTDAPATAPALTVPPVGETSTFYDGGTFDYAAPILGGAFGDFPARLYRIDIPADGDYTITLDWGSPEDLGVYPFLADGTTEAGTPADAGGGGAHPESATSTFTAGTYLLSIVNFSPTNPPSFSIQVTSEAPAAE